MKFFLHKEETSENINIISRSREVERRGNVMKIDNTDIIKKNLLKRIKVE